MTDKPQVVKLAQPGIDVKTAGDEHLVYNSNWPLLKIATQGPFSTTDNANAHQLVVNHNLGYPPAFWIFSNNSFSDWINFPGTVAPNYCEFNGALQSAPGVDNTKLVLDINPSFLRGTEQFYYYIFALDISVPYTAPSIKSGGVIGPRNTSTVFKLAKPGKDISSASLEDYTVHSLARSPLIHAVFPGTTAIDPSIPGGTGFTFYHNLGYVPMFFAYGYNFSLTNNPTPNQYNLLFTDGSGASGFNVDEEKIVYFHPTVGIKVSLLVLKDPFELSDIISVTI